MTRLGKYFENKSVNKARIALKTGISKNRLSQLSLNQKAILSVEELYLIALAIDVTPNDILEFVCEDMTLEK